MARLVTTISGPDYSRRGMKKKIKYAQSVALLNHRKKFMKKHFLESAGGFYPEAYTQHWRSRARRNDRTRRPIKRGTTRIGQLAKGFAKPERGETKDPKNMIPLYDTGLLKMKALHGGTRIQGKAGNLAMTYIGLPYYTYINPPGQLNKVQALEAIASNEATEAARVEEREFVNQLNSEQKIKRG